MVQNVICVAENAVEQPLISVLRSCSNEPRSTGAKLPVVSLD